MADPAATLRARVARWPGALLGIPARLRVHDPDGVRLRNAARAATVVTAVFAGALVGLGRPVVATFGAFGSFSFLALADFQGTPLSRTSAYAVTTVAGFAIVAIGSVAAAAAGTAAAATAVIGGGLLLLGANGGYLAASVMPLVLLGVLATTVPFDVGAVPARVAGVALGGGAAVAGSLLLWPRRERVALHAVTADVCRALAAALSKEDCPQEIVDRIGDLLRRATVANYRAAGPTSRDVAFLWLLKDLDRLAAFLGNRGREVAPVPSAARADILRGAVAGALESTADALDGTGPAPTTDALEAALTAFRDRLLDVGESAMRSGETVEEVLGIFDASFRLRVVSMSVMTLDAHPAEMRAADVDLAKVGTPEASPRRALLRGLRAQLQPSSVDLRNALRGGLALGVAVFVAVSGRFDHAFWVGLGTLSVLRSNAMGTGYTALQALGGTFLGFLAATAVMTLAGGDRGVLWALLPCCVFLAAYAPTALHYVVGQAAFTLLVVVLFNLFVPEGWVTGVVRLADVAVGVIVAVAAGALFWPRGARGQLRAKVAGVWAATAGFLGAASAATLGLAPDDEAAGALAEYSGAAASVGQAMAAYLTERGHGPEEEERWALLVSLAQQLAFAATRLRSQGRFAPLDDACAEARDVFRAEAAIRVASMHMVAVGLLRDVCAARAVPLPAPTPDTGRAAALRCLEACHGAGDLRPGLGVVNLRDWLEEVDLGLAHARDSVMAAAAPDRPWWR